MKIIKNIVPFKPENNAQFFTRQCVYYYTCRLQSILIAGVQ